MTARRVLVAMAAAVAGSVVLLAVLGRPDPEGPGPREPSPSPPTTACEGVSLEPSDDLQAGLDAHPEGTTFCLRPGTYRLDDTLVPRSGQRLVGAGPGVVLTGARPVETSRDDQTWVVTGQQTLGTSEFDHTGQCRTVGERDPGEMCVYRDQVFLDDESLWQVGSLDALSSGEFFWDYETNRIHLADDPSGRTLEVSVVAAAAIGGGNPGVVLENLVIEKFGNPVQTGAVQAERDWSILDSEIRLNHGAGVHMGPGTVLRRNVIHHNGQLGIHGGQATCSAATGLIVEDNEIAFNNIAGYNWGWEGGASKWNHTDGLVVRNNYVHDNYGMGLWTDGANINTLYEGNRVEDNAGMGINHELSFAAVIVDNVVRGNGHEHPVQGAAWGAGIFIDQSRDVEVRGNTVEDNAAGITALQEPAFELCEYGMAETVNVFVHDNTIVQESGIAAGLQLLDTSDSSYFDAANNRWVDNRYTLGDPNGPQFSWEGGPVDGSAWQAAGHDVTGSFSTG